MSLAAKAIQFNLSKKTAQLIKVISFFDTQIADRKFQAQVLTDKFDEQFKKSAEKYEKQMNEIKEKVGPTENQVLSEIKAEYATRYQNLLSESQKHEKMTEIEIGELADKTSHELTLLISDIINISKTLLRSQSSFSNYNIDVNQKISDGAKSDKYKQELKNFEKESKEKYDNYQKECDLKLVDLEEKHRKELLEIQKSFSGDTNEFDAYLDFLSKTREEINKSKDMKEKYDNQYKDTNERKLYFKAKEAVYREIEKLKNDFQEMKEKEKEAEENGKTERGKFIKEENDKKEELSALKASLEFKLSKLQRETKALLEKLQQEFLDKTEASRAKLNEMNKEFEELIKEQNAEIEKFTKRFEESEKETQRNIASKEKLVDETMNFHKLEIDKLEREKASVIAKNERDIVNVKANMKSAKENAISRYELILAQMKADMNNLYGKDKQQIAAAMEDLEKARKEKEEAMKIKEEKLQKYEEETKDIEEKTLSLNENAKKELQSNANDEFHKKQLETDERIDDTMNKNKQNKEEKIKELRENHENTIKKLKEAGYDHSQYEEELKQFKEEFGKAQDILNSIHPPENKDFKILDAEKKDLSAQIDALLSSNQLEKDKLMEHWENEIEDENQRYRNTLSRGNSGRNREQVKQSLAHKIEMVKNEKQEEQERLLKILQKMTQQHMDEMIAANERKFSADDRSAAKKLEEELTSENRNSQKQIFDATKIKQSQISNATFDLETLKTNIENEIKQIKAQTEKENRRFETKMILTKNELEKMITDGKSTEEETRRCFNATIDQENDEFKYYSNKLIAQLKVDREALDQKKKDSLDIISKRKVMDAKELEKYENTRIKAFKQLVNDKDALIEFYDEKISVLSNDLDALMEKYNTRPGRQCDIEQIQSLMIKLQILSNQLKRNAKDLLDYRKLLIIKEKEYNQKFGRQPHIGIPAFA